MFKKIFFLFIYLYHFFVLAITNFIKMYYSNKKMPFTKYCTLDVENHEKANIQGDSEHIKDDITKNLQLLSKYISSSTSTNKKEIFGDNATTVC